MQYPISSLCSGAADDLDRPTSNQHVLPLQFSAVSRTSPERRSSENKSSVASMSQMKMVQKAGKSSLSCEKTSSEILQATSTSSSRAVKEISETERSSSNRVNTITNNKAIVSSSTSSLVR